MAEFYTVYSTIYLQDDKVFLKTPLRVNPLITFFIWCAVFVWGWGVGVGGRDGGRGCAYNGIHFFSVSPYKEKYSLASIPVRGVAFVVIKWWR